MKLIFTNCPLYNLKSKKMLKYLLKINDDKMLNQDYVVTLISPYIEHNGKDRLLEPPNEKLKIIQTRIKNLLGAIEVPCNVYSGVKGRSYVDNAKMHIGSRTRNLYKIDMTAFFPSISRETVYNFFKNDMKCSSDIACILTNFTTVNIDRINIKNIDEINSFLKSKNVKCRNHLISGSPTSQIMSYLVNYKMFDEMQKISNSSNITMTIYVDDVTFSSENRISYKFRKDILDIVKKYNYKVSKKKVKLYTKLYPKLITGVIIDKTGKANIKNSMSRKIMIEFDNFRSNPNDEECRRRLVGLLIAARQINKNAFQSIYKYVNYIK